jgi:hypothetical protein
MIGISSSLLLHNPILLLSSLQLWMIGKENLACLTISRLLQNPIVKVMVWYVTNIPFPGPNPPAVDDTKLNNIIFCAMPAAWQTKFLHVNDVLTTTVLQLQQCMAQAQKISKSTQNPRGGPPGQRNDNPHVNRLGYSCFAGRGGRRNPYSGTRCPWTNNNAPTNNKRQRTLPHDSPCRLHDGTHNWTQGGGGRFYQVGRYNQGQRNYGNNYHSNGRGYQYQN